jgi:hypothetical protein
MPSPSDSVAHRIKPELLATPELAGAIALREGCTVAELLRVMARCLDERDFTTLLNGYVDNLLALQRIAFWISGVDDPATGAAATGAATVGAWLRWRHDCEERLAVAEANYENMTARRDLLQAALDAERAAKC